MRDQVTVKVPSGSDAGYFERSLSWSKVTSYPHFWVEGDKIQLTFPTGEEALKWISWLVHNGFNFEYVFLSEEEAK